MHTTHTNTYPDVVGALEAAPEARATTMPATLSTIRHWMVISAALFVILALLGICMRLIQGDVLPGEQSWFYPLMTLHGDGMAGLWFVAAMACATEALRKHVRASNAVAVFALAGTVVGVALLLVSVLVGRFAAGWYFLYPLPLHGEWPAWSAVTFLLSLTVLGATWLIWSLDMLRAVAERYSLPHALGWHYLRGESEPAIPPAVIIVTVSMIVNVVALVAGVVTLVLFYFQLLTGSPVDALLMKNLTFLFGHTLVNLAMYLALAAVYDALPAYAGRPWKANKIVAISWNSVLLIVLLAYFHHLYMDFVQPGTLQYIGQIASYAASLPAAIVTIFGALLLVYHAPMRWTLASVLFFLGLMGWAIGGIGAVIDSTIVANVRLHNTLWVPAHFHTYMLAGFAMIAGYFYHCGRRSADVDLAAESVGAYQAVILNWLVAGACGFLAMFYLGGAYSVPRRYAVYPVELAHGTAYALWAGAFAAVFLIAAVLCLIEVMASWRKEAAVGEERPAGHPTPIGAPAAAHADH
ncbi:MAG: cbb3-type cytochrome c oxidase subunit I [Acidobacteria bacterium]|nr:cbb3-type cytochrome c oxidase subunit I [Acidobacteriota bacterium]